MRWHHDFDLRINKTEAPTDPESMHKPGSRTYTTHIRYHRVGPQWLQSFEDGGLGDISIGTSGGLYNETPKLPQLRALKSERRNFERTLAAFRCVSRDSDTPRGSRIVAERLPWTGLDHAASIASWWSPGQGC